MTKTAKIVHIPWWRFANLSIPLPEVDIVTINHALAEMHENAVKTIFARLYEMWGDNENKFVIAESLGYDFFKRKSKMFTDICELGFAHSGSKSSAYIWRPNLKASQAELTAATKRPSHLFRAKIQILKNIGTFIRTRIGSNLAKLIGRGPLYEATTNTSQESQIKKIRDFFDDLVPHEKTSDEKFLSQIGHSKF